MNTYFKKCKEHILDNIDNFRGYEHEVSEIGMTLSEGENANGSWYCSTYEAKQDLSKFLDEGSAIEDFIEEYKSEFGNMPYDGLAEPESFHCLMMIIGVEKLFNSLQWTQDNWNDNKKISKKDIEEIKDQLKSMTDFD